MYITINSEFKPFTYDELTKPLRDYTEAYNKVEEQYATLAQQTEAWKNIATQENSPEAYAMYKKYSDELNAVVEDFSRGMTIQNRGKLSGLKSRYASEIEPIKVAYTAMEEANAYRDEVKRADQSAIFNVDRYTSLDSFLHGNIADNTYVSGRTIQADIAQQMAVDSYNMYNELVRSGTSKEQAAKIVSSGNWINNSNIAESVYTNYGIQGQDAKDKAKAFADLGINQGIVSFTNTVNEAIEVEKLAKAKAYSGGGHGGSQGKKESRGELALVVATAFGLNEGNKLGLVTTESTEPSEYEGADTITKTSQSYNKDVAHNNALANPSVDFGTSLVESGFTVERVTKLFKEYEKDFAKNSSEAGSFETWTHNNEAFARSILND